MEPEPLRSRFLLDIQRAFLSGGKAFPKAKGQLDLSTEAAESVTEELLEVIGHYPRPYPFAYQTLVVWGDHVATFTVRESLKKRMDRLVVEVREFPILANPTKIVETYWWCYFAMRQLEDPPGRSRADQELLARVSERWISLSTELTH